MLFQLVLDSMLNPLTLQHHFHGLLVLRRLFNQEYHLGVLPPLILTNYPLNHNQYLILLCDGRSLKLELQQLLLRLLQHQPPRFLKRNGLVVQLLGLQKLFNHRDLPRVLHEHHVSL